jgi:hypothetical protein
VAAGVFAGRDVACNVSTGLTGRASFVDAGLINDAEIFFYPKKTLPLQPNFLMPNNI